MLLYQPFAQKLKNLFSDIHSLPGKNLLIPFDNFTPPNDSAKVLSKGRVETVYEGKISNLNEALPKLGK